MPLHQKLKRIPSLPKVRQSYDPLAGLHADTDFVKANKQDFQSSLKRLGSINKLRTSLKTIKLEHSYTTTHKKGDLPEFYIENKLKLQKEKEDERIRLEEERIYNENK